MVSRYKILREKIEPSSPKPIKTKIVIPVKQRLIRAREVGSEGQFKWAVEANLIKNLKIIERNVKTVYSKQYPEGYELIRAEFDIVDPKCAWSQYHKKSWCIGDKVYEKTGCYDNEFEIIYPKNLKNLDKLNIEALTEHLQNYYATELYHLIDE